MAKQEAELSNSLSIFWLKKHGYLDGGWRCGSIKWTYVLSGNKSSIGFNVNIGGDEDDYIKLQYTYTNKWSGKKESLDYKVRLTTTPCNYGGVRYWFVCPLTKDGQYCGRRVGVIYNIGKWFGCRHCGDICYANQLRSSKLRGGSISYPDVEKAKQKVKRKYYNGRMTRKYRRVIRMKGKLNNDLIRMMILSK